MTDPVADDVPDDASEPSETGSPDDARSGPRLLLDRTFGPYIAGKLLSTMGVWIHNTAAAIVVWELTRSALLVGAVSAAKFLPQLLLAPWSGARADRGDRRRQIVAGRLVTAAGAIGLVVWSLTVGLHGIPGAIAVISTSLVVGLGFVLGSPAMQALIPAMVRPQELSAAVAVSSLPPTVGRAVGPAIGAILVTTLHPAVAFSVAAFTNVFYAAVMAWIPIRAVERTPSPDARIRAGWRYVRGDAGMSALLLAVVTVGVGADPVVTLTPAVAAHLGAGSSFVGVLASAFGVGAGLAFVPLGRLRRRFGLARLGAAGLATMSVSMLSTAVAWNQPVAVLSLAAAGTGMTFALTSLTTLIQQQVPENLRGRVMALWGVAFLGSRPLAASVSGWLTDAISVTVALLVVSAVVAVGAYMARPGRTTRPRQAAALRP